MISRVSEWIFQDMEVPFDNMEEFIANVQPSVFPAQGSAIPSMLPTVPDINSPPSPNILLDMDIQQDPYQDIEEVINNQLSQEGMITANSIPESPCSVSSNDSDCSDGPLIYSDVHPMYWDKANVKSWVQQKTQEYGLTNVNLENFNMTGSELCLLTYADFCNLCEDGDLLFLGLEIQLGNQNQTGVSMHDLLKGFFPYGNGCFPEPLFSEVPIDFSQIPTELMKQDDLSPDSPQSVSDTDTDLSSETLSVNEYDDDWMPPVKKPKAPSKKPRTSSVSKASGVKPLKVIHGRRGRPRSDGYPQSQ